MEIIHISVYYGTNCYLICDKIQGLCAIVDPGGDAGKIVEAVTDSGCIPTAILLTHGHYDHTGGVKKLRAGWPELPVYLNRRDIYEDADIKTRRLYPPIGQTLDYDEGDSVTVGGLEIHVLATPGHSCGSVSLLVEDVLLSGDTLFASSMGRTDLFGGSDEQMRHSLKRLSTLPGSLRLLPGHMQASTLDLERSCNPYLISAMKASE